MTPRRRLLVLTIVALLVAAAACGGDDGDAATTTTAPGGTTSTTETDADPIALLDGGAEPRSPLRLTLSPGDRVTQRMAMEIDIDLTVGDQSQQIDSPRTVLDLEMEVLEAVGGVYTVRSTITAADIDDPGADPQVAEQSRQLLQTMVGTTYRQRLDDRAVFRGADPPDIPDAVPEQARGILDQLSAQVAQQGVAFPAEPVGVGARWTRGTDLTTSGVRFTIRFEYHLIERTGDDYVLEVSYEQDVVPGPVELPGTSATATAESGRLTGSGRLEGSLTSMLSTGGVQASGEVAMQIDEGGTRTPMHQRLSITTEMSRPG